MSDNYFLTPDQEPNGSDKKSPLMALPDKLTEKLAKLEDFFRVSTTGALMCLALIAGGMTGLSDLQASNLGAIGRPLYLAGARVTRIYPMGPRPGIPAMVAMLTYDGTCCIAINYDPEAITDVASFSTCLREGFDEVTALAGTA